MTPEQFARMMRNANLRIGKLGVSLVATAIAKGYLERTAPGTVVITAIGMSALDRVPLRGRPPLGDKARSREVKVWTTSTVEKWITEAAARKGMKPSAFAHSVFLCEMLREKMSAAPVAAHGPDCPASGAQANACDCGGPVRESTSPAT